MHVLYLISPITRGPKILTMRVLYDTCNNFSGQRDKKYFETSPSIAQTLHWRFHCLADHETPHRNHGPWESWRSFPSKSTRRSSYCNTQWRRGFSFMNQWTHVSLCYILADLHPNRISGSAWVTYMVAYQPLAILEVLFNFSVIIY